MHVEKGYPLSLFETSPFDINQLSTDFTQAPNRDVAGDNRVRNAGQSPFPEVNVRAAYFAQLDLQQGRIRFKLRVRRLRADPAQPVAWA
jgi:hypothetical protein